MSITNAKKSPVQSSAASRAKGILRSLFTRTSAPSQRATAVREAARREALTRCGLLSLY